MNKIIRFKETKIRNERMKILYERTETLKNNLATVYVITEWNGQNYENSEDYILAVRQTLEEAQKIVDGRHYPGGCSIEKHFLNEMI